MTKVIVFGGRNYPWRDHVFDALDHLHQRFHIEKLAHGGASGADQHAHVWATLRGVRPYPVLAQWDVIDHPEAIVKRNKWGRAYNVLAGFWRNQRLVDHYRPDFAVEFPGGSGTADMRERLDAAGVPVIQIYDHDFASHLMEWVERRAFG